MSKYHTLRLTEHEIESVRSLCSVTVDCGDDTSPEDLDALARVIDKIDTAQAKPARDLCPNCQSHKHAQCCARCGRTVPRRRVGFTFCSSKCERVQAREDAASAQQEPSHD